MDRQKAVARANEEPEIEFRPKILRRTLSYDDHSMLCRFRMPKGAAIELHEHEALQNGFIIAGRLRFLREDGTSFEVGPGDGYVFAPWEKHGSEALEESDFIEFFAPCRPEYIPQ